MPDLKKLKSIADETLGGLHAKPFSLNKRETSLNAFSLRRLVFACLLFVALSGALFALNRPNSTPIIETRFAGLPTAGVYSAMGLPRGSLILSSEASPPYIGLWVGGKDGNFPLVRVDGRYYRLLTHPQPLDTALLGETVGSVAVYTQEPALDQGQESLSNILPEGESLYLIRGMGKSALAGMIDGQMRVFERCSFAGAARLSGEGFDSFLGQEQPILIQLSGVGSVDDPEQIRTLMSALSGAAYEGGQARSGKQSLILQYANGVALQWTVKDGSFSACGRWSCPAFFEQFEKAAH